MPLPIWRRSTVSAFTLIELLIVIAIIAILALIAVPNFLEAQTRAKTARVQSDFVALATAMESYFMDHGTYPGDGENDPYDPVQRGFYQLTTPVAYISIRPQDPFGKGQQGFSEAAPMYEMGSGADNRVPVQTYVLLSVGPDGTDDTGGNDEFPFDCDILPYSPTNGTVSRGDICRFGGEYWAGDWRLDGVDHRVWGQVARSYPD